MHLNSTFTTSILLAICFIPNAISAAEKAQITDYYSIEKIALPEGIPPEVGAVKFDSLCSASPWRYFDGKAK
jgi:hypothetical protein